MRILGTAILFMLITGCAYIYPCKLTTDKNCPTQIWKD